MSSSYMMTSPSTQWHIVHCPFCWSVLRDVRLIRETYFICIPDCWSVPASFPMSWAEVPSRRCRSLRRRRAEHLLTDTEKTTVFTGSAKEVIATFPRRVNVAVATSLATTGPDITGVTMHSVPGWVGDDHCITAEIEGVKAVVDICSSTSAIAGWSAVALLRNLASPVCFY